MNNIIELLKNGNYKPENQFFRNMDRFISYGNFKPFPIESELTNEEKIEIMDKYSNGLVSYMISIINKWNEEKDSLPKDQWDSPKTVSEKAWIKRNDTRKIVDDDYKIGSYHMFGIKFTRLDLICPNTEYGHNMGYTGQNIINQWFYDFCYKQLQEEEKWFKDNDPLQIKIKKVKELGERYRIVFNCKLLNDIVWNKVPKITDKELDAFINAYEELEKCITEQTKKISEALGEEVMYKEEE
jgi:hypothetical protein